MSTHPRTFFSMRAGGGDDPLEIRDQLKIVADTLELILQGYILEGTMSLVLMRHVLEGLNESIEKLDLFRETNGSPF